MTQNPKNQRVGSAYWPGQNLLEFLLPECIMLRMRDTDSRKLSLPALRERRRLAVKMRLKGAKLDDISETLGMGKGAIISATKRCKEGGWAAVDLKKRGRRTGTGRRLTAEQETEIQRIIRDKTPDQLKMPFALWTRGAIVDLIKAKFDSCQGTPRLPQLCDTQFAAPVPGVSWCWRGGSQLVYPRLS